MSAVVLDEVHCLWPSCSHTCCWESEQRVREGHPKILKAPNKPFTRPCRESRFPVFTSVDAANWIDQDFISLIALSRDAASQKHRHSTTPMSAKMETSQDTEMLKTEEAHLHWESLSARVFPPEHWMSRGSDVKTKRQSEVYSPMLCTNSGYRDVVQADTASPKGPNPRFKPRALKNTDMKLSRRIFQSSRRPELNWDLQSDSELFIRGITAPQNSCQSSLASSTVDLNQLKNGGSRRGFKEKEARKEK